MGEVESVSAKKETSVVVKRIAIGTAVGGAQVVFEKIDSDRAVSGDKFGAVQNIGPLALATLGVIMTIVPKKQQMKTIGADLTSSSSAMLAYRAFTLAGVSNSLRKLRSFKTAGRQRSNFSSSTPNLF